MNLLRQSGAMHRLRLIERLYRIFYRIFVMDQPCSLELEVCRMQLVNCLRNQILRILACILNFAQMRTCIYIKQGSLPIKRRQSIRVRVYLV